MNKVGSRGAKKAQLASAATHEATRRLRALYPDDYAMLLAEERAARGLPEETHREVLARLRERIEELEAELREKVGPA